MRLSSKGTVDVLELKEGRKRYREKEEERGGRINTFE